MDISTEFTQFLAKTPQALEYLFNVMWEFTKLQSSPAVLPVTSPDGPDHFDFDQPPVMTTTGLTWDEIDAMADKLGEAVVREKAILAIKSFILGLTIRA